MDPFGLGGQQPLVLALLPLDPREVVGPREPAVDGPAELGLAPETGGEDDVRDGEVEPAAELGEPAQLVQLAQPVEAVAGRGAPRDDEPEPLEVAEHPRRPAAAPPCLGDRELVHGRNLTTIVSGFARALAPVAVLEADDVVQLRRRDLEDGRVLERGDAVNGAGDEVEGGTRADHLLVQGPLPRLAQLELGAPRLDVPALVLLLVELEAEGVAGADEEHLADVGVRVRPDQLVAPGLLDAARLERPPIEAFEVRAVDRHQATTLRGRHSGWDSMNSAARRRSFGVLTVSQTPSCR